MPVTSTIEPRVPLCISDEKTCIPIRVRSDVIEWSNEGGKVSHPQILEHIYDFAENIGKDTPFLMEDLYAYLCEIFGEGEDSAMRFITKEILENTIEDDFFYFFEWEFSSDIQRFIYWPI